MKKKFEGIKYSETDLEFKSSIVQNTYITIKFTNFSNFYKKRL